MKYLRHICLFFLVVFLATESASQIIEIPELEKFNADSVRREYDKRPYFGLYKDNYFIVGTALDEKPNQQNSDVKFQISISQRLTKSVLPFNSYLFLFYSQKCIWNVFEESLPMRDLNFNPGIGISKPLISKNKIIGKITLMVEHESNGRDSIESRSWNKISLGGNIYLTPWMMLHAKYWIPIIDGSNNKDILKYSGIGKIGAQYVSSNKRWVFDATYVKRQGWNFKGNLSMSAGFRLHRDANQFLMFHYYHGYGENLLDYNKFRSRLRIGLLIRPKFFSDF